MQKPTRTRIAAQQGYDLWATSYDQTPNPVVTLDARYTIGHLAPVEGERILDAGCGTGRNIGPLLNAGATVFGADYSEGMIAVAREKHPEVDLVQTSLDALPDHLIDFDAILCTLVGEHLVDLNAVFASFARALVPGGRLVFSVYHPWMAAAGIQANFTVADTEYRLGAETHTVEDYVKGISSNGFLEVSTHTYNVDAWLVERVPAAAKYLNSHFWLSSLQSVRSV